MVIKQGKVKSVPVSEVTEGMQVVLKNQIINLIGDMLFNKDLIEVCKTLVVEYELEKKNYSLDNSYTKKFKEMQIPLKFKQWQAAIDNNEVDSEKIVNFELKQRYNFYCSCGGEEDKCLAGMDCKGEGKWEGYIARIIPQKTKKTLPSEDEQLEKLSNLLTSHDVRKYLNINGIGYSQVERDIVKLFNLMFKP
jgi:hypothetical protein